MVDAPRIGARLPPGFRTAALQITNPAAKDGDWDITEEAAGAEFDIETELRHKLAGLRRLPARERVHALRAAKDARRYALNALKEKRQTARRANYRARLEQKPTPC